MADVVYGSSSLSAAYFGAQLVVKGYLGDTLLFVSGATVYDGGSSTSAVTAAITAGGASDSFDAIIFSGGAA